MEIIEVTNEVNNVRFHSINMLVNKGNPHYIRPLDDDINSIFKPSSNKYLKEGGKAKRWILRDNYGKLAGRIAAFINPKYKNKGTDYKTGGIGFFDCTNSQFNANMLFDTAKEWLRENGAEAMDGPINLGERDKWWGLMVDGFDKPPAYGMSYNPSYYQSLFEGYGFKNFYNQYYFTMAVDKPFNQKVIERHARFKAKPEYSARHAELKNISKYATDFATVYNAAWAQHGEGKEISEKEVKKMFKQLKPIMDERLVWFAYYKEEPIALFVNIPDLNEYFKHFNGKFGIIEKIRLLWMKRKGVCKKATGLAFGVVPKFQSLGIDSFIIQETGLHIQGKGWYEGYEMGWSGDWNPRILNLYKGINAVQSRQMVTYRYIFDENKHPFERHPVMEYGKHASESKEVSQ